MPATSRTLNLRLPPELVEDFRRVSGAEDRSIAGEVRHLMRERVALARSQKDEGPDADPGLATTSADGTGGHGSVYP